jgi:biopolymer transport protein ExbB
MISLMQQGGVTMWILLFISIGMVAVIIERVIRLREASADTIIFLAKLARLMQEGRLGDAMGFCDRSNAAIAVVASAGLSKLGRPKEEVKDTLSSAVALQTHRLGRNLPVLGTIASASPFVGLFGTVLGIMTAFRGTAGNMQDAVSAGIAEALICTAAGLAVAIVALVSYNLFQTWIQRFEVDFEVVSTEILHLLNSEEGIAR